MTGVAIRTRTLVTRIVQTMIGIRNRVIPGARILKIVTRKLMPPRIELVPMRTRAMIHRSWPGARRLERPVGRERRVATSSRPPPTPPTKKPESRRIPPSGSIQNDSALIRGKAMSGAPIMERHDVVPEARQHRDDEQEDHHRGVHREQLVVDVLVGEELEAGLGELRPDDEREDPADEEEDERVDDVHDPDLLVIGRRQPLVQAAPVGGGGGGRQRVGRHSALLT